MFRSNAILLAAYGLVAFAVRLWWVLAVQRPGEAVYSDISGYVGRAARMVQGGPSDPMEACWPYGAHYVYAAEMALFGVRNYEAMAVGQAVLGAGAVVFTLATALQLLPRPAAHAVGAASALWYPWIALCGFFSSETPFTFFLTGAVWAWVRLVRTGRGALLAGVLSALCFTVRPVPLLAFGLCGAMLLIRRPPGFGWRSVAGLAAPFLLVVAFSSVRLHHYTGELGLISTNGPVMRFFADTDYRAIHATNAKGDVRAKFLLPSRSRTEWFTETYRFVGRTACDGKLLEPERRRVLAESPWSARAVRAAKNVALLATGNPLWPERNEAKAGWRRAVFEVFGVGTTGLAVVGLVGLAPLARRRDPGLGIVALHVLALMIAAVLYAGEVRYRVPYDGLLLVLAAHLLVCTAGAVRSAR